MSNVYSAHPALASEQLQRAECGAGNRTQHRRHNLASSSGSGSGGGSSSSSGSVGSPTKFKSYTSKVGKSISTTAAVPQFNTDDAPQKPTTTALPSLPDRTAYVAHADDDFENVLEFDGVSGGSDNNTKDCVDCAPTPSAPSLASIDEPDHLQQRFSHRNNATTTHQTSRQLHRSGSFGGGGAEADCSISKTTNIATGVGLHDGDGLGVGFSGCASGLSSVISSPSPSTASSPLSTPTRLAPQLHHSHAHCCQKSGTGDALGVSSSALSSSSHHHHLHHHQVHHAHGPHSSAAAAAAAAAANGCKKFDPRLGPSPYRQLLPIALCILSFATVFSILIVYMDTTEIRHQQFRLNMSRDSELYGVAQDDPTLIAFLREIHMRKYPMHFLKQRGGADEGADATSSSTSSASAEQHHNYSSAAAAAAYHDALTAEMAHYVADLVGGRMNGAAIQSLPGTLGHLMTAPWLSETLNWAGVIVEPEPRRYFALRKQNAQRQRLQVVHACVSPNPYPKEVTIHNEESEVRINSLLDEETSWFNSRVKCFPLYTIMLACNRVEYDLLSLGVHGHELEILQTLPFDKIKIDVISIHLHDEHDETLHMLGYIQSITKFLMGKSYKLQKKFGHNYFYQRINASTSRTRKKDILLLKTP